MPQPSFAGINFPTFGGLALPNGQGTLSNINLNDVTSWFLQDISIEHGNRTIGLAPQLNRAKSVYTDDDFLNKTITLPTRYLEVSNPIGQALAKLSQAGEQQLSFDGTTYILAKYRGTRAEPKLLRKFAPFYWALDLQFICREPWFKDIASTTSSTVSLVGAPTTPPSGSATSGGAMTAGTYTLAYTYVTASGETAASPAMTVVPTTAVDDDRVSRIIKRGASRTTGSALQTQMAGTGQSRREFSGASTTRVLPQGSSVTLAGANLQISVAAVSLPSWATAVRWYVMTGPTGTTGFTVQNANGNAFTLNTIGNGTGPPSSSPATAFTVAYSGSVFAEPIYTVTIPSSNPSSISSLVLTNTMSSEALTITPSSLILGGRSVTLSIDAGAWTITDGAGTSYDYSGSFPQLYGPAGQSNAFTLAVTGTPSDTSGVTIAATYANRWEE